MTSPLEPFRRALAERAAAAAGSAGDASLIASLVEQIRVPEPERGDLALPCHPLARAAREKPDALAARVAAALADDPRVARAETAGAFVNVRLAPAALATAVVPAARAADYGGGREGEGKTVVIDFSSPNIAKPLAFHHIRSTVIGAAIGRIYAARGWRVVGINYLGDWGKQFGLLATGFARHGEPARRADAKHLVEVYVRANREADVDAREAAVNAPAAARALVDELVKLRASRQAAAPGDADAKKLESRARAAEKKLRAERRLPAAFDGDVLDDVESWLAELAAKAAVAQAELPAARARDLEALRFFKSLEEGEPAARAEWTAFRETSIQEFQRVYARMGVAFTAIEGESFYNESLASTIARVAERPGTRVSDGALIVDLPYKPGEPPVLLQTQHGTTLYITRDLAAAADRHARFGFDLALYVVAHDQSLHFAQLTRTLAAMGYDWAARVCHVPFGRVHGMSTRRGDIVFLDEVLDDAVAKAREICAGSGKIDTSSAAEFDATVEAIGVGAVVFGDLRNGRLSDYTFRLEDVLDFDGHTGPYVQYSHARACSIVARGGGVPADADLSLLVLPQERAVLMALAAFPDAVREACAANEPSLVTRALLAVAGAASTYLTAGKQNRGMRVLLEADDLRAALDSARDGDALREAGLDRVAATDLRAARLHLIDAVRNTLARGLALIGVKAPVAM